MHSADWRVFDTHCDTLDMLLEGKTLRDTDLHFSVSAAERFKKYIQVMAFCIYGNRIDHPFEKTLQGLRALRTYPQIRTGKDLMENEDTVSFLLCVEGGEAIEGSLDNLQTLFTEGVRIMTLTWNCVNDISDSAAQLTAPGGLTPFGKTVISEMERLGMAVDVSHISEKGFWDVIEVARKPIIASHSCAKGLCPHYRNLTEAQFMAICEGGGVVGVNFYPLFLGGNNVHDIIKHILYFLSLGGENHIGFGSDFDGIPNLPEGISGAGDVDKIINALLRENISEEIVRKITYANMEKYFLKVLPKA